MRRELRGERMNYLCIDIEWNTPDNPAEQAELLSIGAACWDSVSKMTRTYFKLIKPQRMDLITSDTYRRLNLGPVVLEQAKPCKVLHRSWRLDESAFKRKQQPDEGYHQQVVYNKDIYETADYIYEHDRHYLDSDYIPSYYGGSGEND